MKHLPLLIVAIALTAAAARKPDIVSVRANIEDYYTYVNGRWVWSEDAAAIRAARKPKAKRRAAYCNFAALDPIILLFKSDRAPCGLNGGHYVRK